uniref:PSI domain-containing protein n=1 Tax=Echinostoma caproni TaxID=27848 RepID=A0A183A9A3_9TREM
LSNCGAYHTCKACLEARDPYCGWCIAEGRCARMDQCQVPQLDLFTQNRAKRRQQRKRESSGMKQQQQQHPEYCSNKFTPGYALQSPISSWLPYTSSISMCPTIREISPPGILGRSVASPQFGQPYSTMNPISSVVLRPDDSLANDPRFRAFAFNESSSHWPPGSVPFEPRQLVCAFRAAPDSWTRSSPSLLSGLWLPAEQTHSLLVNIRPGPVLATSPARPVFSPNGTLEVHCEPPLIHKLPSLPKRQAAFLLILWLDWFTPTGNKNNGAKRDSYSSIAPGLFAIYDCAQLSDCRACTQSRFSCAWCLLDDRCVPRPPGVHDVTHSCSGSNTVFSGTTTLPGADDAAPLIVEPGHFNECPRFKNDGQQITLMSGTPLDVTFQVFNVKINVTKELSGLHHRIADLQPDRERDRTPAPATGINCSLNLYWHGHDLRNREGHRMINEDDVKVEVYSCELLAKHCDECLALPTRFGCGWCMWSVPGQTLSDSRFQCTRSKQCLLKRPAGSSTGQVFADGARTMSYRTRWLQSGDVCPDPQILSIAFNLSVMMHFYIDLIYLRPKTLTKMAIGLVNLPYRLKLFIVFRLSRSHSPLLLITVPSMIMLSMVGLKLNCALQTPRNVLIHIT